MGRLKGKTAVVTGASSGIGREIAARYASEGAYVLLNYKSNRQGAELLAKQITQAGGQCELLCADVSSEAGLADLLEAPKIAANEVDIWVNNAGADILTGDNAEMSDQAKLQCLLNVDLLGTINCCWAMAPKMKERGSGVIINMSWDLSVFGFAGRNPQMFAAVKAGILGFSKSLALSYSPEVRVNVLAPGWIQTAFADDAMDNSYYQARIKEIPLGRFGLGQDVAAAALYLGSDEAAYITGQVLNINGGLV